MTVPDASARPSPIVVQGRRRHRRRTVLPGGSDLLRVGEEILSPLAIQLVESDAKPLLDGIVVGDAFFDGRQQLGHSLVTPGIEDVHHCRETEGIRGRGPVPLVREAAVHGPQRRHLTTRGEFQRVRVEAVAAVSCQ